MQVNGLLQRVIDIGENKNLQTFVDILNRIKMPGHICAEAKRLRLDPPSLIQSVNELQLELLKDDWRNIPAQFEFPSNSQFFGHMAAQAGIDGIMYPSKFTGKCCLAIFIRNFQHSISFVEIADETPKGVPLLRIDQNTFSQAEV